MRSPLRRRGLAVVAAAAALAASCSSDSSDSAPTTTMVAATTTTIAERPDDDVLRIGVVLPVTGAGQELGLPMLEAIEQARSEINAAGGVNGRNVLVTSADEGRDTSAAVSAFQSLVDDGVDAIIGPASSNVALSALGIPVENEIVTCSPTATALALDDYPARNLFFRTIPSDSLQMRAVARTAQLTGARRLAVIALDDPYGRGLADALGDAAAELNLEVSNRIDVGPDDERVTDDALLALAGEPPVLAVLGDIDDGTRILVAIGELLEGADAIPEIIVNDALRAPLSQQSLERISEPVRRAITGVSPQAFTEDGPPGPYAANAYDCAMLIALAAVQAESDDPSALADRLTAVSAGGRVCSTFAECADIVREGRAIDYDGPSGNTELSSTTGDPTRARFDRWGFDPETGQDITTDAPIVVER